MVVGVDIMGLRKEGCAAGYEMYRKEGREATA